MESSGRIVHYIHYTSHKSAVRHHQWMHRTAPVPCRAVEVSSDWNVLASCTIVPETLAYGISITYRKYQVSLLREVCCLSRVFDSTVLLADSRAW